MLLAGMGSGGVSKLYYLSGTMSFRLGLGGFQPTGPFVSAMLLLLIKIRLKYGLGLALIRHVEIWPEFSKIEKACLIHNYNNTPARFQVFMKLKGRISQVSVKGGGWVKL